uniref:Uncharacterized protein n=1 Tax=Tetradesmus obliquus TaxID=3088 RepID=A0A383WBJ7_TETOB|eukprot:jgi/Sobl393_1/16692/SZX74394.1
MRAAKQAEDAASKLRNLVHRPQVVQLLQRPLPAAPTAEQQAVLASCSSTLQQLKLALTDSYNSRSGTESVVQVLRRTLRHQPVHSAGVLLAWLQQQPQQLAASLKSSRGLDPGTLEAVWTVGMLMVAGLADLLLECVLASWIELAQQLLQQQQQQQQQQQSQAHQGAWQALLKLFRVLLIMPNIWTNVMLDVPSEVPTLVQAALPLLRQLQCYSRLLATGTAATATATATAAAAAAAAADHSSRDDVWLKYSKLPLACGDFVYQLSYLVAKKRLGAAAEAPAVSLLREPAVAHLVLQSVTAYTSVLHQQHTEMQQQQQQPGQSSKQQLRADLLPIPAFHQHPDMLQLLPDGQAFLNASVLVLVDTFCSGAAGTRHAVVGQAQKQAAALESIMDGCMQRDSLAADGYAPLLSAAAARLLLELQLLAAGDVQRQRQQRMAAPDVDASMRLLLTSTSLQHRQLKAVLQAGASCLPPEVLQQAGQQLLQSLAAPLQQLQLTAADDPFRASAAHAAAAGPSRPIKSDGFMGQQLLALRAAAPGLTGPGLVLPASDLEATSLFRLAAAHPEAFTALVDCYVRSPVLTAADMAAAIEVLAHAAVAVLGSSNRPAGALHNTAAAAGLSSAIASFTSAQCS